MLAKEFDRLVNQTVDTCKDILVAKGGEYAHGEDRLDNFKRNAADLGLTAEEVWAIYFRKHLDAISTYVKDIRKDIDRPRSEDILGRFDDAINYLMLGKGLVIDRQKQQNKK